MKGMLAGQITNGHGYATMHAEGGKIPRTLLTSFIMTTKVKNGGSDQREN